MKWEYQLMRDMLERATLHLSVPSPECHKTGAMLRQAHNVMMHWDLKIVKFETALQRIHKTEILSEWEMRQIAREALE